MVTVNYNRIKAVEYAKTWAFKRNPKFYNFDNLGGDCTNFVSQCLYASSQTMNYTPIFGWFYNDLNNRAPSWSGVEFLYKFLISNKRIGPFAEIVETNLLQLGDVIQLGNDNGNFYHTMIVTKKVNNDIYTSSHTIDSLDRPLISYNYNQIRNLHILGIRK